MKLDVQGVYTEQMLCNPTETVAFGCKSAVPNLVKQALDSVTSLSLVSC